MTIATSSLFNDGLTYEDMQAVIQESYDGILVTDCTESRHG